MSLSEQGGFYSNTKLASNWLTIFQKKKKLTL